MKERSRSELYDMLIERSDQLISQNVEVAKLRSRIAERADDMHAMTKRIAELEAENARLRGELRVAAYRYSNIKDALAAARNAMLHEEHWLRTLYVNKPQDLIDGCDNLKRAADAADAALADKETGT